MQIPNINRRIKELIILDRTHKAVLLHLLILKLDLVPQIRKEVHNNPRIYFNQQNNQEENIEEVPEHPEVVDSHETWGDCPPDCFVVNRFFWIDCHSSTLRFK